MAWVLERRSYSERGQSKLDGLIVAPAGTGLKLDPIRRLDGDQKFTLGPGEGREGEPILKFKDRIKEMKRERLIERKLLKAGQEQPVAWLYFPLGSWTQVSASGDSALIELVLPWEKEAARFNLGVSVYDDNP